ncbi:MAG: hypothetical protein E7397_04790 [Ruminococcaceae bacterium]|nr:hypothetical protein [Oscillospiraceae bacterium]
MNIQCVKTFDLGIPAKQVRSIPVSVGEGKEAILFVYSLDPGVDPGEEYYHHPIDTFKMALFDCDGNKMWMRDLGEGVIPGVWFCPVVAIDLDQDGVDEIYFVNNTNPNRPFSFVYRYLEAINPLTGESIGRWKWADNTFEDRLSLCYRFYLVAGYAKGEPVLITSQGTYGDMYLQGWGTGMVKKWETVIKKDDPGPRASHLTPVLDFNDDGIDELFWGERLLSFEDGSEICCYDKFEYSAHSDIIIPFMDYKTGERYLYTCREGEDERGIPRVVTFREDGTKAWTDLTQGHMHHGWLAAMEKEGEIRRIAMAGLQKKVFAEHGIVDDDTEYHLYDAITGEPVDIAFACNPIDLCPIDLNGDGFSEFYCIKGDEIGMVFDVHGNPVTKIEGQMVKNGQLLKKYPCEQIMVIDEKGIVRIYADTDAKGSEIFRMRHAYKNYHDRNQKLMASGYNCYRSNISCGI